MFTRSLPLIVATLALVACASSVDEGVPARAPVRSTTGLVPPGPANAASPPPRNRGRGIDDAQQEPALGGKIAGTDFFPVAALAFPGKTPGTRDLHIYDFEASCGAKPSLLRAGNRRVDAEVPWRVGSSVDAREARLTSAVYSRDEDDWQARPITTGTIVVEEASADSQTFGRVRIDAKDGADALSGSIYVVVCEK